MAHKRGSSVTRPAPVLDVIESFNGLRILGNNPSIQGCDFRSSVLTGGSSLNPTMFPTTFGAPGVMGYDATAGRFVQTWTSGAGNLGLSSQIASGFSMPLGRRFSLAGSVPVALLPPFRRYRVDYLVRVTVAGASEVGCGVGQDAAPFLVAGNNPLVAWSSRAAVNGGRWTPRHRLVTAGALIDGPDSGVSAAGWVRLSIIYEEGPAPRIRWLVNETQVSELAGDAAVLTVAAAATLPIQKVLGAPAGTTVLFAETRFRVDEL